MLYLNQHHIESIGVDWLSIIQVIENTIKRLATREYAQPIKPYLRYQDLKNRIIAMPAYVGGDAPMSGIKWIASFPDNNQRNLPRAHSVTILNEATSGRPLCTINTTLVSGIRTAGVSGVLLREYLRNKPDNQRFSVGIMGFGPIGQLHLSLVQALLGDRLKQVSIFDIRPMSDAQRTLLEPYGDKVQLVDSWEKAYDKSDIVITCTVSAQRYINRPPAKGSLQLNVSLRDYMPDMLDATDLVIVDDWDEVCRENTDIEIMHQQKGLQKEHTYSIIDVLEKPLFQDCPPDAVIMFNPMGMAVFDIAIGGYYFQLATCQNVGTLLPD